MDSDTPKHAFEFYMQMLKVLKVLLVDDIKPNMRS